jgi:branched-subunit amino acid aminotransferase/4-amino-4-deoxychorismate lyase
MLVAAGQVIEGPRFNVFAVFGRVIITLMHGVPIGG